MVFPALLGPSTLTNKPRLRSEEGCGVILAPSCRLVSKFFQRPPACEMDEDPRCHKGVVASPMRLEISV